MKVFIASDLHLEFGKLPTRQFPDADTLILAGDIGNVFRNRPLYENFLKTCNERYSATILITGNHEYYGCNYDRNSVDSEITKIVLQYDKVHFLNNETKVINGVEFIGTTLWSLIDKISYSRINDGANSVFRNQIEYVEEFVRDYQFLKTALARKADIPRVVITHHLPTSRLIHSRFRDSEINSAFYTHIIDNVEMHNVKLWACGHTHEFQTIKYMDATLVVNPIGYPSEVRETKFSTATYEI
jgi:Icc-related predicted phosphoesterase